MDEEHAGRGYLARCKQILAEFLDVSCMQWVDLHVNLKKGSPKLEPDIMEQQNFLANLWGHMKWNCATLRVVRGLWLMLGWPHRMVGVLTSEERKERTINGFKRPISRSLSSVISMMRGSRSTAKKS